MPYKTWVNGDGWDDIDANFVGGQLVFRFASVADRSAQLASPVHGMVSYLLDSSELQVFDGAAWVEAGGGGGGGGEPFALPPGGAIGQVLVKLSGADGDVGWATPYAPPAPPPPGNDLRSNATPVVIATDGDTWDSGPVDATGATTTYDDGHDDAVEDSYFHSLWWTYTPATSGTIDVVRSATGNSAPVHSILYAVEAGTGNFTSAERSVPEGSASLSVDGGQRYDLVMFQFDATATPGIYSVSVTGPASA